MRARVLMFLGVLAACEPGAPPSGGDEEVVRGLTEPKPKDPGDALTVPMSADDTARQEILAHVPDASVESTGEDGASLLGVPTDAPSADPTDPEPIPVEGRPQAVVKLGKAEKQADLSNPGIERAARAGLYFNLVQRCRGPDGALLPPEAIQVRFTVDHNGFIAHATIEVKPKEPAYDDAAQCMRRELSTVSFRVPASARGQTATITALVPSVD